MTTYAWAVRAAIAALLRGDANMFAKAIRWLTWEETADAELLKEWWG